MRRLLSLTLPFLLLLLLLSPSAEAVSGTPSFDAARATYKIVAYSRSPFLGGEAMWSGTAWKLDDEEMMTAGHVCDDREVSEPPVFRVYNTIGQSWPAEVIAWKNDGTFDLCALKASPPGPSLRLAPGMPAYDAPLYYVGAPHGIWYDDMMPVYHGRYAGGSLAIIGGAPGASGSAMMSDDGVVGVLVSGIESGNLIFFVSMEKIKLFLYEAGL